VTREIVHKNIENLVQTLSKGSLVQAIASHWRSLCENDSLTPTHVEKGRRRAGLASTGQTFQSVHGLLLPHFTLPAVD